MSYEFEKIERDVGVAEEIDDVEKEELKESLYIRRDKEKSKREESERKMIEDEFPAHTDDKTEIELVDIENLDNEEFILFKRLLELEEKDTTQNDINEYDIALDDYHEELEKVYLKEERAREDYDALKDPRENFHAWLKNNLMKIQLAELHRNNKAA